MSEIRDYKLLNLLFIPCFLCSHYIKEKCITNFSTQKFKGQWRTLKKDAIPSRNLPSDSPVPYHKRNSSWTPPNDVTDARVSSTRMF